MLPFSSICCILSTDNTCIFCDGLTLAFQKDNQHILLAFHRVFVRASQSSAQNPIRASSCDHDDVRWKVHRCRNFSHQQLIHAELLDEMILVSWISSTKSSFSSFSSLEQRADIVSINSVWYSGITIRGRR